MKPFHKCLLIVVLSLVPLQGCTRVRVRKVTCPQDEGIRYYRPKPYLLVMGAPGGGSEPTLTIEQGRPLEFKQVALNAAAPILQASFSQKDESGGESEAKSDGGEPARKPSKVGDEPQTTSRSIPISMKLEYLPDFAEEYTIDFRPGFGSGELNVNLENGWNLTSIGVKTDQQTDEIIGSVASVLEKAAAFGSTASPDKRGNQSFLYGSNVPFGFYEAVIACDPHGRKQLYGWRYIGFMPFQSCPVQAHGMQTNCCNSDAVYGLVHVNGVLQFQEIGSIPKTPVASDGTEQPVTEYSVP